MKKCHAKKNCFGLNNCLSNLAVLYGLCVLDISFLYWPLLCEGYLISSACLFFILLIMANMKLRCSGLSKHWDPDQTGPGASDGSQSSLFRFCTVFQSACIVWTNPCISKLYCSRFWITTGIFMIFSSPEPCWWAYSIAMVRRLSIIHHFQRSSSPKPLGISKSNFIWSLSWMGERKFNDLVAWYVAFRPWALHSLFKWWP